MAAGFRKFRRIASVQNQTAVTYYVDTDNRYEENVKTGDSVLSPKSFTPTKSGYTFLGWREDTVASSDVLVEKVAEEGEETTLYAVFSKAITLTTYNGAITATTESKDLYYNNSNVLGPSFTLTENAVINWTKAGWTNNVNDYSTMVVDGGTITLTANATYYSLYAYAITVTLYNGDTTATTENKNRIANYHNNGITYSDPIFTLTENTISGWNKAGWTNTANFTKSVDDGGTVTLSANATFYSLYTSTITVTYYNNSSSAATETGDRIARAGTAWAYSNPTFNLTEESVANWAPRGWSTSNTGNAAIAYSDSTDFTRESNITLYSLYQRTVTLTYNGNGNTGGSTGNTTGTAYRNAIGNNVDASIVLATNGYTKTNYQFSKWAKGSVSGTQYSAGATVTLGDDTTFYAIWKQNTYSVPINSLSGRYAYGSGVHSESSNLNNTISYGAHTAGDGYAYVGTGSFNVSGYSKVQVTARFYGWGNKPISAAALMFNGTRVDAISTTVTKTINLNGATTASISIDRTFDSGYDSWLELEISAITLIA